MATGVSSLVFRVNQLPSNGSCTVRPTSGQILTTLFQITCTNWEDPDGSIERYEYFGKEIFSIFYIHKNMSYYFILIIKSHPKRITNPNRIQL